MITYLKDNKKYKEKPTDPGRIKKSLGKISSLKAADVKEFAVDCVKYSVAPISITRDAKRGLEDKQWASQQAFLFDIDNSAVISYKNGKKEIIKRLPEHYVELEDILDICINADIMPTFIYTTMSHVDEWKRYRVGFIADKLISDENIRRSFVKSMARLLSKNEYSIVDLSCLDPSRIFYPGLEMIYEDNEAKLSVASVIERGEQIKSFVLEYNDSEESYIHSNKIEIDKLPAPSANQVVEMIRNYNIEGLQFWLQDKGVTPLVNVKGSECEEVENHCEIRDCWFPVNLYTLNHGVMIYNSISSLYSTSFNVCRSTKSGETLVIIRGFDDLIHITSSIPLTDFFGIGFSTRCICHEDSKPSATVRVYVDDESGCSQYRYFCHSNNCTLKHTTENDVYSANILDLIANIQETSIGNAIDFLSKVLNIKFISIKQLEAYNNIDALLEFLSDENTFFKEYPRLYQYVKHHISKLVEFLKLAAKYIKNFHNSSISYDDSLIFSVSLRKMQEGMLAAGVKGVSDIHRLNERITLFVLLGLIEKVEEVNIQENRLLAARRASRYKNANGYEISSKYHTAFYKIPTFNRKLLNHAENQVVKLAEQKYSKSSLGFEAIRRAKGQDATLKVFPQSSGRELSKYYDKLQDNIEKIILKLINVNGYVHKEQVLLKLRGYSFKDKESAYQKLLPALLDKNTLCWVRVNNETRSKYKVDNSIPSNSHILVKSIK